MTTTRAMGSLLVVLTLSALSTIPAWGGGWAIITLDALPASPQAGEALSVGFTVLQHGRTPLAGLSPRIVATHAESGERVQVEAIDEGAVGHYAATLVLPSAGSWDWTIRAFGDVAQPMPQIHVAPAISVAPQPLTGPVAPWVFGIAAALSVGGIVLAFRRRYALAGVSVGLAVTLAAAGLAVSQPAAMAAAEAAPAASSTGAGLFLAKGCVTCHVHQAVPESHDISISIGPELTPYRNDPEFIARWLADPTAVRRTEMPNLHLSPEEIAALVLFLNGADDS